ncbi:proteasome stabiliser-domain-containing protein [Spinellus fusiger]|nr:proteasome stabiliser-domain-containing protein [Spinellus fusiger]
MTTNELQLLENVELKLALCNTDTQLESIIRMFLTPLLLKVTSTDKRARSKVMEILSHINKRVKASQSIQLPFEALLNQLIDDKIPVAVKNFTVIYLEMAVSRVSSEEAVQRIPQFLMGISRRPVTQQRTLLHMVLPLLNQWKLGDGNHTTARNDMFKFDDNPKDVSVIVGFFLDVLLYQFSSARSQTVTDSSSSELKSEPVYPGLSPMAVENVTNKGKIVWSALKMTEARLGIFRFLLTPIFTDSERLRLLLVGVCDTNHQVVSVCEDGLRRWASNVDMENTVFVQSLYSLYLGTKSTTVAGKQEARAPVSAPVKIRILQYLSKSVMAANLVSLMIQVVFDGIYGEQSNLRLRRSAMSFLQWTARIGDATKLSPMAPILISGLLQYIDQEREASSHDVDEIKGYAYAACGLISKKVPKVALNDTAMLSKFFDALEEEKPNTRVYVQDALSSMIEIYINLPEDSPAYEPLQKILLTAVEKNNSNTRYMALKYVNAIYPFSCVFARYVCLLGSSNSISKLEVKEESIRGLHPFAPSDSGLFYASKETVPISALPKFSDLVNYIATHQPGDEYTYASKTPCIKGYPTEVYSEILRFLRMILILEANPTNILIDQYVEDKVENSMSEDPITMENFKVLIDTWWMGEGNEKEALSQWLQLIENALNQNLKDSILLATAAKCLLEAISLGPCSISTTFQPRLSFFKSLATCEKIEARTLMSHIVGIIASDPSIPQSQVEAILDEFCLVLEQPETHHHSGGIVDQKHGALLAVGYLLGRCYYRSRELSDTIVKRCIKNLALYLEGAPTVTFYLLSSAACHSLAEVGRVCPLLLPSEIKTEATGSDMEVDSDQELTVQKVVEKLVVLSKTCKDTKVQERALLALGHLSIPMASDSGLVKIILDAMFASADSKQVELFFAGGEAFSLLAFGWESQTMHKYKDIRDIPALDSSILSEAMKNRSEAFQVIIEKMTRSYVTSDRTWYKKAACIWLLSVLKFGKDQDIVKKNLGAIHASFSRLLSDRDDFTQEVASKGLGLVYEYGDEKVKEDMLYSLVGIFTEGRSIQAQSVTDNTVLFDEGSLGTTPEGSSIITYKELCSLASELNQPDLIYKFMNLANHNAMWTSRRGAAFGFQNLMTLAEKEMEPYMARLIPKLYRYQFDPNPGVHQSMKAIWNSLVKDNQKTVDIYFDQIMDDILSGIGNRQWRVREASCAAVTECIQGRPLAQIQKYLEPLWKMSFRALDDIKGSVRQAATQTCKALTRLTLHYCDPSVVSSSDGIKVIDIVMPFLLQKGIVSDAEDVQKFSLNAVLKLCKTGAVLLKAYIPDIIDTLLQSLSSLEPQSMNYLSFHTEKYNISQEQLDNARLQGAKNSPMMEGIEHCVAHIDEAVMEILTPRIIHIVKKGTGLPTKAGCARFIVTLCMNRSTIFQPYADTFLKALSGAIRAKNPAVRKSFATATGYVARLASFDTTVSFINHLKKLYIKEQDEEYHLSSAITALEMTRFATDRMNAVATDIVPLIYYGEHDPEKNLSDLWKEAWESLTSGTRSRVNLYMDEIIQFVQPLLSSSSWKVKQTAALTIADLCKSGSQGIAKHTTKLIPIMVSTLASRSWAGKENVLEAFVQLCISAPDYFKTQEPSLEGVVKILVREAKRTNRTYQRYALASLKTFLDTFGSRVDALSSVKDFLIDLCEMDETAAMEEESDREIKPLLLAIKANAFKALASAFYPQVFSTQEQDTYLLVNIMTKCLEGNVWNVQVAIFESLKTLVDQAGASNLSLSVLELVLENSCLYLGNMKYSAIRTAALEVLESAVTPNTVHEDLKTKYGHKMNTCLQKEPVALIRERLQALLLKL